MTSTTQPLGTPRPPSARSDDGPLSALLSGDQHEVERFDFFQALRLLDEHFPDALNLRASLRSDAPRVAVRPHEGMGFPSADVRNIESIADDREGRRLIVTFLGLYGVDSPLPSYFANAAVGRDGETPALREFLDIFNARIYALLYEALKKYRLALPTASPAGADAPSHLACLAGLGAPASDSVVPVAALIPFAGVLRAPVRNVEGLVRLIADRFAGVPVTVVENVPRWIDMESPPRLGGATVLGSNALLGGRLLDVSGRFRIVLGPVGWEQFESLRPGGNDAAVLNDIVTVYAPDFLDFEVELRIKSTDLPDTRLGRRSNRMGRTTWIGIPLETIVSEIVTYR